MKKFFNYYQEEIAKLRTGGKEFARRYPEIAHQIDFKDGVSSDPHTERIIESVAYMAANLHSVIDANSQNIAYYLLSAICPNMIATIPPCTIITMKHPKQHTQKDVIKIAKGADVNATSSDDQNIIFKTLYDLVIYPINITDASITKNYAHLSDDTPWSIEIILNDYSGKGFVELCCNNLVLFLNSDVIENALMIYEAIFSNKHDAYIKVDDSFIQLSTDNIVQYGFDDESSICPISDYSNNAMQLLQEIIHFKQKFMFFACKNISNILSANVTQSKVTQLSLIFFIKFNNNNILSTVNKKSFLLNCTPVVNLFRMKSDPFIFDGTQNKYRLSANKMRNDIVIHDIISVSMVDSISQEQIIISPYFSLNKVDAGNNVNKMYWTSSIDGDIRYLSIVDKCMNISKSYDDVFYADVNCYNAFSIRDIPSQTKFAMYGVSNGGYIPIAIYPPTSPVSFRDSHNTMWMLVSSLASTNISIADADKLLQSISKLMHIFACGFHVKYSEFIDNIVDIKVSRITKRFGTIAWRGFVTGCSVQIYIADDSISYYTYLFACALNNYLSTFVSINSFVELSIVSAKSNKTLAFWPATSGRKDLI